MFFNVYLLFKLQDTYVLITQFVLKILDIFKFIDKFELKHSLQIALKLKVCIKCLKLKISILIFEA